MFKTVKDPAKWMKYHLRYVSAAARRTVRQATTEAEKWRVLRVALAADPLNYPAEYARPTADRTARRLTGCDGYAALVAALLAGERVPVCRQRTTQDEADARDLRYTLLANLLLALGD